ncbi:MAG: hypothetical protein JXB29_08975 [Sedimentisphaerales bacterium]|nr:hypothetical protein [Sedimentisphaerales bacterium]
MTKQSIIWILCLMVLAGFAGAATENADQKSEYAKFVDSDAFVKQQNICLTEGTKATIGQTDGSVIDATAVIDGSIEDTSYVEATGIPFEVIIELASMERISGVRIFPGQIIYAANPSGECGIKDYQILGFRNGGWIELVAVKDAKRYNKTNASGIYTFNYTHSFDAKSVEALKIIVTASNDTGKRVSGEIVAEKDKSSTIREIQIFSADKLRKTDIYPLKSLIESDYLAPAYLNRKKATLLLKPTELLKEPKKLKITFYEMDTNRVPLKKPLFAEVKPGKDSFVEISIESWLEGQYVTKIESDKPGLTDGDRLLRVLRIQRILEPARPAEPVNVKGLQMLFFDDWYMQNETNLKRTVHPTEQYPITSPQLESQGRVSFRARYLAINKDGLFETRFSAGKAKSDSKKVFTATSKDCIHWDIVPKDSPDKSEHTIKKDPITGVFPADVKKVNYKFHETSDGIPTIDQVTVKWSGHRNPKPKWGDIEVAYRSVYPVWEKTPGNFIILTKEPLITDKLEFDDKNLGTWKNSNDNFGGIWKSKDGKTLFYAHGRMIPRHQPFKVLFDNIPEAYRIVTVWRTQDGFNWQPSFMTLPTEKDVAGYQHYGARTFAVENGNLRLGYLWTYECMDQRIYIDIIYSRDSILWKRFEDEPSFNPNGEFGSWNGGMIFTDVPYIVKDGYAYELLNNVTSKAHFYGRIDVTGEYLERRYGKRNLKEQWTSWDKFGSWDALAKNIREQFSISGVMKFRENGWVSVEPKNKQQPGSFTTRILQAGDSLSVNAETYKQGYIKVEVLDDSGNTLDDYCGKNAAIFTGDSVNGTLTWKKGVVKTLPKQPIRLKVTIKNTDLYSLNW